MGFSEKLNCLRKNARLSQKELAERLGVSQASVNYWEKGQRTPSIDMVCIIADYFRVSVDYLISEDEKSKSPSKSKGVKVPVLGRVAAGVPISAVEEIIDTEEITEELAKTGEFFGLQIHGDSMEPRICDGDIVIVRQQEDAENGDIVIVSVNDTDATCKRLRKYRDGIELISTNPSYEPIFFYNKDINEHRVKVLGKVIELRAKFK